MNETIIRDIDIVAGKEKTPRLVDESASVTVNGNQVSNVVFLDANDNVPVEITNAGVGATIIIDGAAGTINNGASSIIPLNNQSILGGGVSVTGINTGLNAPLGTRPTITANNTVDVFDITATNNHLIKAIDIDGEANGFDINASSNSTYSGITVSNLTSNAFDLNASNNNTMSGITATTIGATGFLLNASDNNQITNTDVINSTNAGSYGIVVVLSSGNSIKNFTISDSGIFGIFSIFDSNTAYSDGIIKNSASTGVNGLTKANLTLNNISVENAGAHSFAFSTATLQE